MAREEIIAAPLSLYLAPRGEAFPDLGATPSGNWELLGKSGDKNYTDDGVTVGLPQSIEEFIPAGSAMAVKAFRTEESVEIVVTVADVRAEVLAYALDADTTEESGGDVSVPLLRGIDVTEYALLARGRSPYDESGTGQFQVPACYQAGEPEPVYNKGEPAGVELTFRSLLPTDDEADNFRAIFTGSGSS